MKRYTTYMKVTNAVGSQSITVELQSTDRRADAMLLTQALLKSVDLMGDAALIQSVWTFDHRMEIVYLSWDASANDGKLQVFDYGYPIGAYNLEEPGLYFGHR